MVGMGGRSKACDNCRRRHVKCDLATPQCKRCIKARLDCKGCRDLTVIQYNGGRMSIAAKSDSGKTVELDAPAPIFFNRNDQLPELYNSWSLSVPYDDIFAKYTISNLHHGTEGTVMPLTADRVLTRKCFVALSTIYFGVEHMEKSIVQRGFQRYGYALGDLNMALSDPKARQSFDTLEAIAVMATCELLVSNSKDGWIYHSRGLEQLLKIKGPESMTSLPCLIILEKSRTTMIFAALVLHQSTIFSQPEWKVIPWLAHPERQHAMKFLGDIMADCTELFLQKDAMNLELDESCRHSAHKTVLDQANETFRNLESWKQNLMPTLASQCTEIPSPSTTPIIISPDQQNRRAWSTILHYSLLEDANVLVLYHSVIIMVLTFIQSLENEQSYCVNTSERLLTAGMTICRSIDYHLTTIRDGVGNLFLLFPLKMAYNTVGVAYPTIGTWLNGILKNISSGSAGRWAAAQYLLDINPSPRNL